MDKTCRIVNMEAGLLAVVPAAAARRRLWTRFRPSYVVVKVLPATSVLEITLPRRSKVWLSDINGRIAGM